MFIYSTRVCVRVCEIECVSREKQIHLSSLDKDARNKEEGEILLQKGAGEGRKESQTDVPVTPNLSPCHLPLCCSDVQVVILHFNVDGLKRKLMHHMQMCYFPHAFSTHSAAEIACREANGKKKHGSFTLLE